jgi:hypothetical protein
MQVHDQVFHAVHALVCQKHIWHMHDTKPHYGSACRVPAQRTNRRPGSDHIGGRSSERGDEGAARMHMAPTWSCFPAGTGHLLRARWTALVRQSRPGLDRVDTGTCGSPPLPSGGRAGGQAGRQDAVHAINAATATSLAYVRIPAAGRQAGTTCVVVVVAEDRSATNNLAVT